MRADVQYARTHASTFTLHMTPKYAQTLHANECLARSLAPFASSTPSPVSRFRVGHPVKTENLRSYRNEHFVGVIEGIDDLEASGRVHVRWNTNKRGNFDGTS